MTPDEALYLGIAALLNGDKDVTLRELTLVEYLEQIAAIPHRRSVAEHRGIKPKHPTPQDIAREGLRRWEEQVDKRRAKNIRE